MQPRPPPSAPRRFRDDGRGDGAAAAMALSARVALVRGDAAAAEERLAEVGQLAESPSAQAGSTGRGGAIGRQGRCDAARRDLDKQRAAMARLGFRLLGLECEWALGRIERRCAAAAAAERTLQALREEAAVRRGPLGGLAEQTARLMGEPVKTGESVNRWIDESGDGSWSSRQLTRSPINPSNHQLSTINLQSSTGPNQSRTRLHDPDDAADQDHPHPPR